MLQSPFLQPAKVKAEVDKSETAGPFREGLGPFREGLLRVCVRCVGFLSALSFGYFGTLVRK